jgi:hypothetical protein
MTALGTSLLGCSNSSTPSISGTMVLASTPAYSLTAQQLQREYAANEIQAELKYKNRIVEVSGVVTEIGREMLTKKHTLFFDPWM